jgi:hypothetical protein
MDTRHRFKITAIKSRIEFCEAEHRRLLRMLESNAAVNLAWISERMEQVERDLRFLFRDLRREEELEDEAG